MNVYWRIQGDDHRHTVPWSTWPVNLTMASWYGNTMEFYWERTEHGGFSNVFNISVSFQKHPPKMDNLHKFTGNSGQTLVNRCENRLFRFASSVLVSLTWHLSCWGSCWGMTSRRSSSNVWSRTQSSWKICQSYPGLIHPVFLAGSMTSMGISCTIF